MYLSKNVNPLLYLALSLLLSCNNEPKKIQTQEPYTGPVSVVDDFHAIFSDSARVLYKIASNHMEEMQNGDRVFPQGIYLETLDGKEKIESTLRSDSAYFIKKKQLWILKKDVQLHNLNTKEQMFSEELFWDMKAKDSTNVYVKEKTYVTIKTPTQGFTGYGLRTNQDFKNYEILNISGIFDVSEEEPLNKEKKSPLNNKVNKE
jgi:LPS export ABC transporter protein LptC